VLRERCERNTDEIRDDESLRHVLSSPPVSSSSQQLVHKHVNNARPSSTPIRYCIPVPITGKTTQCASLLSLVPKSAPPPPRCHFTHCHYLAFCFCSFSSFVLVLLALYRSICFFSSSRFSFFSSLFFAFFILFHLPFPLCFVLSFVSLLFRSFIYFSFSS
jgi:hypothetical protein